VILRLPALIRTETGLPIWSGRWSRIELRSQRQNFNRAKIFAKHVDPAGGWLTPVGAIGAALPPTYPWHNGGSPVSSSDALMGFERRLLGPALLPDEFESQ